MSNAARLFPYLLPDLTPGETEYLEMHARRFHHTLGLVRRFMGPETAAGPRRLLDIGPSSFTFILRHDTAARVNQLGYLAYAGPGKPRAGEEHFEYDLDRTVDRSAWPQLPPHDLVLAAEVVEHLHASANHWLPFLQSCTAPGGHLIITTPNGVALRRRLMMLAGVHPYEKIRDDPKVPGHFREFTKGELVAYGQAHGLRLVHFEGHAHLDYPFTSGKAYNRLTAVLPASLRDTMYLVFRNEK